VLSLEVQVESKGVGKTVDDVEEGVDESGQARCQSDQETFDTGDESDQGWGKSIDEELNSAQFQVGGDWSEGGGGERDKVRQELSS